MTFKSFFIKVNAVFKNIFFYLAWFLFFIAFYIGGAGGYVACWIYAFILSRIYIFMTKGDLDSDVFMQDKFYFLLKHIAFFIGCICLAKIVFNYCFYDKSFVVSDDNSSNFILFVVFGLVYLYPARVYKNYKIYFKKYLALALAMFFAWWYYDGLIKQPNELIKRILKSELKCRNLERECLVLDKSILDDINDRLKGKSYDEIQRLLSQFDFESKYESYYFYKILLSKGVSIRLELEDDKIIEIMVFKF